MFLQVSQSSVWEEATEIYSSSYFSSEHKCELHQEVKFGLDRESWHLSHRIIERRFQNFENMLLEDRYTGVSKQRCAFLTIISFRSVLRKVVT